MTDERRKPPYYDHDRRQLSDAVRRGDVERARRLTRRAIQAQMRLLSRDPKKG